MKLVAMLTDPKSIAHYLEKLGEPRQLPCRSPSRGPPYWKSRVLRQRAATGSQFIDAWVQFRPSRVLGQVRLRR
jgi:hypothetical protein